MIKKTKEKTVMHAREMKALRERRWQNAVLSSMLKGNWWWSSNDWHFMLLRRHARNGSFALRGLTLKTWMSQRLACWSTALHPRMIRLGPGKRYVQYHFGAETGAAIIYMEDQRGSDIIGRWGTNANALSCSRSSVRRYRCWQFWVGQRLRRKRTRHPFVFFFSRRFSVFQ